MTHTYNITGMTCNGCIAKAKSQLLKIRDVTEADVQLAAPQATIKMQKHIPVETLRAGLSLAGNYTITEADGGMSRSMSSEEKRSWLETYKPILIVFAYITGITVLAEITRGTFLKWVGVSPVIFLNCVERCATLL